MENYGLPAVEKLLRSVVRMILRAEFADAWDSDGLSRGARKALARNGESVRSQRPDAQTQSDWDLAGLPQMRDVIVGKYSQSEPFRDAMSPLWDSVEKASVDLQRLKDYRDRALHGVDPPLSTPEEDELRAIVHRVRFGLEQIRRSLAEENDDFWPYIESVSTNIPGWSYRRDGIQQQERVRLIAGDLLEFRVSAVNPRGSDADLVYELGHSTDDLSHGSVVVQTAPTITYEAPEGRDVVFWVGVKSQAAHEDGRHFSDHVYFPALVRPRLEGDDTQG